MLPDFRKTPHVEDFSTPVGCDLDTREKVEKTRGQWLWGKEKKMKVKPATDLLFDSFQVQTPKDQRPNIPEKTISQSHHLERQLWMRWIEWMIMDIDHSEESFEPWHACRGSIIALSIEGLIWRCLFHSTWVVYVYLCTIKDTVKLSDTHQTVTSWWKRLLNFISIKNMHAVDVACRGFFIEGI